MTTKVETLNDQERKTLASQLDRLDTILDTLSEGLNEAAASAVEKAVGLAVKQAVGQAVAQAVHEAVQAVLTEVLTRELSCAPKALSVTPRSSPGQGALLKRTFVRRQSALGTVEGADLGCSSAPWFGRRLGGLPVPSGPSRRQEPPPRLTTLLAREGLLPAGPSPGWRCPEPAYRTPRPRSAAARTSFSPRTPSWPSRPGPPWRRPSSSS